MVVTSARQVVPKSQGKTFRPASLGAQGIWRSGDLAPGAPGRLTSETESILFIFGGKNQGFPGAMIHRAAGSLDEDA